MQTKPKFAARNINTIYCSDIDRCKLSLEYILNRILLTPNAEIHYTNNLLEHDMGDYDGMSIAEVETLNHGFTNKRANDRWNIRPPNGENYYDVMQRVEKLLKQITSQIVLIMGHKAVNKIVVGTLMGLSKDDMYNLSMPCGVVYYIKGSKLYKL